MKPRLYRSREQRLLAGVLGGLAAYFNHDVVLWRLGFIALLLFIGLLPGVLVYLLFWVIVPVEPVVSPLSDADYTVIQ